MHAIWVPISMEEFLIAEKKTEGDIGRNFVSSGESNTGCNSPGNNISICLGKIYTALESFSVHKGRRSSLDLGRVIV